MITRPRTAWKIGPLASRDFRLLSTGQLTSTVGDGFLWVALPWLVLSASRGALTLGTVMACYGVTRAGMLTVGGALADRVGPRLIMLTSDLGRLCLLAGLAVISVKHAASLPTLCPLAALLGAGSGLFIPASMAIMPTLLVPDQLQAGNGIFTAMTQTGAFLGPVLAGVLVATAGPSPAFLADAVTFAVSAVTLTLIGRRAPHARTPSPSAAARPPGGMWTLLRKWRVLRLVLLQITMGSLVFGGAFEVALPALAHLRFGPAAYGALLASLGIGAVLGTLAAARVKPLAKPMIIASMAFLGQGVAISLVPFLGGLGGALAAILLYGMCNGLGNVIFLTVIQRTAPAHLLGRVMSLILLANWGIFPLSVAIAGLAVTRLRPSLFFPVAGAVMAVPLLAALTQRDFRTLGARPAAEPPAVPPLASELRLPAGRQAGTSECPQDAARCAADGPRGWAWWAAWLARFKDASGAG